MGHLYPSKHLLVVTLLKIWRGKSEINVLNRHGSIDYFDIVTGGRDATGASVDTTSRSKWAYTANTHEAGEGIDSGNERTRR